MEGDIRRVVALGASNLTRGFHAVVSTARNAWGPDLEVLAALGHGRSYGAQSRVLARSLPGILESGLWRDLESRSPLVTRGFVTDVGNDIFYGFSAEQVLAWVAEAIARLRRFTADITVTDLPLANAQRMSDAGFLLFRSILVPSCHLSLTEVRTRAERVNAGLAVLAAAHGARFVRLNPEWYGLDPIHIRRSRCCQAWQQILGTEANADGSRSSPAERVRLSLMPPERRWLFGVEQVTPQKGVALRSGARVWLY
jgi:hypothetical protein